MDKTNPEGFRVFSIEVLSDDENDGDIYVAYVDSDLNEAIEALNLPIDCEVFTRELPKNTEGVDWYLSYGGAIYLGEDTHYHTPI